MAYMETCGPSSSLTARKLCCVTGSRADYGLVRPVMKAIRERKDSFRLQLLVYGSHFSAAGGGSYQIVENDFGEIDAAVDMATEGDADDPVSISHALGKGLSECADALAVLQPDLVILLGDRFELLAIASACLLGRVPMAHCIGGDLTQGAQDEQVRHAISKMAHIHFASTEHAARILVQMGEDPSRIHVAGNPGLYEINSGDGVASKEGLREELDSIYPGTYTAAHKASLVVVVVFHPETHLPPDENFSLVDRMISALDRVSLESQKTGSCTHLIFIAPNCDSSNQGIREKMEKYCSARQANCTFIINLKREFYLSLLKNLAHILVGNSSSGLYEMPSFKKPTLNIGKRQKGRLLSDSIICCDGVSDSEMYDSFQAALRIDCRDVINVYGNGDASVIIRALESHSDFKTLLAKNFHERIGGVTALNDCDFDQHAVPPWPVFSDEARSTVDAVLRSGKVNVWGGTQVDLFAKEFGEYLRTTAEGKSERPVYTVPCTNGSTALELSLIALDIVAGDEVIVAPRSFIISASCPVLIGAIPVFADVSDDGSMSASSISKVLSEKSKAVILPHIGGQPCTDILRVVELCTGSDLGLVEDCSQAHGARFDGQHVGTFGDVATWSFCQDKIFTTGGEGGMVATRSNDKFRKMWGWKDHGRDWDLCFDTSIKWRPGFRNLCASFGTNMRMTEMQASLGRHFLRGLDENVRTRRRNAEILVRAFSKGSERLRKAIVFPPLDSKQGYNSCYKVYGFVSLNFFDVPTVGHLAATVSQRAEAPCTVGVTCELFKERCFLNAPNAFLNPTGCPTARELAEKQIMFVCHPSISQLQMENMGSRLRNAFEDLICEAESSSCFGS